MLLSRRYFFFFSSKVVVAVIFFICLIDSNNTVFLKPTTVQLIVIIPPQLPHFCHFLSSPPTWTSSFPALCLLTCCYGGKRSAVSVSPNAPPTSCGDNFFPKSKFPPKLIEISEQTILVRKPENSQLPISGHKLKHVFELWPGKIASFSWRKSYLWKMAVHWGETNPKNKLGVLSNKHLLRRRTRVSATRHRSPTQNTPIMEQKQATSKRKFNEDTRQKASRPNSALVF